MLLLSGCAAGPAGQPEPTRKPALTQYTVDASVQLDGEKVLTEGRWATRCKLDVEEPWMIANVDDGATEMPSLTAGHGTPGSRQLMVITANGDAWYGDETKGLELELDESGLRASGTVLSSVDYDVTAEIAIDMPCGLVE